LLKEKHTDYQGEQSAQETLLQGVGVALPLRMQKGRINYFNNQAQI
jgi:hypothetical protein